MFINIGWPCGFYGNSVSPQFAAMPVQCPILPVRGPGQVARNSIQATQGALPAMQSPVQPAHVPAIPALVPCPMATGQIRASAIIRGGPLAPEITGVVVFKDVPGGTEVCVDVSGLPPYKPAGDGDNPVGPHGFHIHQLGNCETTNPGEPFKDAGEHWNPDGQPHGNHAGDFPVLFSNNGCARMCFFTDRFKPRDVVGKSVIIHQNPDDYRTQPAGNAGKRLACGVIRAVG